MDFNSTASSDLTANDTHTHSRGEERASGSLSQATMSSHHWKTGQGHSRRQQSLEKQAHPDVLTPFPAEGRSHTTEEGLGRHRQQAGSSLSRSSQPLVEFNHSMTPHQGRKSVTILPDTRFPERALSERENRVVNKKERVYDF